MQAIQPRVEILTPIGIHDLKLIELAGRTCYKSEEKITVDSTEEFVRMLIKRGHEAMIEHSMLSVKFTCDRGVSHEIVRHRLASYAQESTRYCNYCGYDMQFIEPFDIGEYDYLLWQETCETAEKRYNEMVLKGTSPQWARDILPNSLKTEIVMTANFREWRNFFKLRTSAAAHPQMQQVAIPLLHYCQCTLSPVFGDITPNQEFPRAMWAFLKNGGIDID